MTEEKVQNIEQQSQPIQQAVQPPTPNMRYSGFWVRGAASFLDGLIVAILSVVVMIPLSMVIGLVTMFSDSIVINILGQFVSAVIGFAVVWGYYILMTHKFQATLGKMAVGVKVISEDGENLSFGNIAIREIIGKFISGFIMGIGYLMIAFTSKKQGLHDMIAKSVVVCKDATRGPNAVVVVLVYITIVFFMIGLAVVIALIIFAIITAVAAGTSMDTGTFVNMIQQGVNGEGIDIVPMIIEGVEGMEVDGL